MNFLVKIIWKSICFHHEREKKYEMFKISTKNMSTYTSTSKIFVNFLHLNDTRVTYYNMYNIWYDVIVFFDNIYQFIFTNYWKIIISELSKYIPEGRIDPMTFYNMMEQTDMSYYLAKVLFKTILLDISSIFNCELNAPSNQVCLARQRLSFVVFQKLF